MAELFSDYLTYQLLFGQATAGRRQPTLAAPIFFAASAHLGDELHGMSRTSSLDSLTEKPHVPIKERLMRGGSTRVSNRSESCRRPNSLHGDASRHTTSPGASSGQRGASPLVFVPDGESGLPDAFVLGDVARGGLTQCHSREAEGGAEELISPNLESEVGLDAGSGAAVVERGSPRNNSWTPPQEPPPQSPQPNIQQRRTCSFRANRRKKSWEKSSDDSARGSRLTVNGNGPQRSGTLQPRRSPLSVQLSAPSTQQRAKLSSSSTPPLSPLSVNGSPGCESQSPSSPVVNNVRRTSIDSLAAARIQILLGLCHTPKTSTLSLTIERIRNLPPDIGSVWVSVRHYEEGMLREVREVEGKGLEASSTVRVILATKPKKLKKTQLHVEVFGYAGRESGLRLGGVVLGGASKMGVSAEAQWNQLNATIGFPATMWHHLNPH